MLQNTNSLALASIKKSLWVRILDEIDEYRVKDNQFTQFYAQLLSMDTHFCSSKFSIGENRARLGIYKKKSWICFISKPETIWTWDFITWFIFKLFIYRI